MATPPHKFLLEIKNSVDGLVQQLSQKEVEVKKEDDPKYFVRSLYWFENGFFTNLFWSRIMA